eukprot:CAMPEP_0172833518 /NCGR_PEP_ID=MMETSP1075-20121228/24422_1 /TAXON_ID=2916 /ORGANISM="Ceratium fusus, Strain PA161109" /LENGTH=39 /DNA_ID= /DNA_START= /DNA_END= /DNA_ORIENTATION=
MGSTEDQEHVTQCNVNPPSSFSAHAHDGMHVNAEESPPK